MHDIAYATKDQLAVYKSTSRGRGAVPTDYVVLEVTHTSGGQIARLLATNGNIAIQRGISLVAGAADGTYYIPNKVVEQAYKSMSAGDRVYFQTDNRLTVRSVEHDPKTMTESTEVTSIIPCTSQLPFDLPEANALVERILRQPVPKSKVVVDAKLLKNVLGQFKHGNNVAWLTISVTDDETPLVVTAFENLQGEEILAAVAPIQDIKRNE